jgi:membrane protease YdiL (CAAX protease family)
MNEEIKQVLFRILPFFAIIIGISIAIKRKKLTKADLYIQKPNSYKRLLKWWLGFLIFIILTEITLYKFGILEVSTWKNSLFPSILKIFGMVVLAPIGEELVFRALLLHKLNKWKINHHVAIFIQALIFVALHSAAFQITLSSNIGKAQILVDALFFAYAMYDTKSVSTPIIMHATGNSVAVLEQFIL